MWVFLGFGEVNSTLYKAVDWSGLGLHAALFLPADRKSSQATRQRLAASGAPLLNDPARLVQANVILSAVTPGSAVEVARATAPLLRAGCIYVDLNSIAGPAASLMGEVITRHGGRFVDAAIMGPVPLLKLEVPIVLSGPHARAFQQEAERIGLNISVISERVSDASSLKMLWSVLTKGTIGLLTESLIAAHRLGLLNNVSALLAQEYGRTGSERMILRMLRSTTRSGVRRMDEMRAARATLEHVEVPSHMVDGTLVWLDLLSQIEPARETETVDEVVVAISDWLEAKQGSQHAKPD